MSEQAVPCYVKNSEEIKRKRRDQRRDTPLAVKIEAVNLVKSGLPKATVARKLNLAESTLRGWVKNPNLIIERSSSIHSVTSDNPTGSLFENFAIDKIKCDEAIVDENRGMLPEGALDLYDQCSNVGSKRQRDFPEYEIRAVDLSSYYPLTGTEKNSVVSSVQALNLLNCGLSPDEVANLFTIAKSIDKECRTNEAFRAAYQELRKKGQTSDVDLLEVHVHLLRRMETLADQIFLQRSIQLTHVDVCISDYMLEVLSQYYRMVLTSFENVRHHVFMSQLPLPKRRRTSDQPVYEYGKLESTEKLGIDFSNPKSPEKSIEEDNAQSRPVPLTSH